jgi:hypothetical protein
MNDERTVPLRDGVARILRGSELSARDAWRAAFAQRCKDHRFYQVVEQTLQSGFEHEYLLLENKSGAARAIQPLFFREIITWAIEQGLQRYRSSPLNYNPKLHLGCELMPLDLYVQHTQPLLNPVLRRALKFLGPTRHDPVLQRFPNAHELH